MKASFLKSLIGLTMKEATNRALKKNYSVTPCEKGGAVASIAMPKTVIIEYENGIVVSASAGDPCEVEE